MFVSRHVVFDENKFPCKKKDSPSSITCLTDFLASSSTKTTYQTLVATMDASPHIPLPYNIMNELSSTLDPIVDVISDSPSNSIHDHSPLPPQPVVIESLADQNNLMDCTAQFPDQGNIISDSGSPFLFLHSLISESSPNVTQV